VFITNVPKPTGGQTLGRRAEAGGRADEQSPSLRFFDVLCRVILYGVVTIGCGLYTVFDRDGWCGHRALSKVIVGIVAGWCSYATQFIIFPRGIEICIQNDQWKKSVTEHFALLWALLSAVVITHLFSSICETKR